MTTRKPLVDVGGQTQELPAGDDIETGGQEITVTNGNAGAITMGMPVYFDAADSVDKAQADAVGTEPVIGLVSEASIAAAATGQVAFDGVITLAVWTPVTGAALLTAGAKYFLSPGTAGQMTTTAPTGAGEFVRPIGHAKSTTEFLIEIGESVLKV